MKKTLNELTTGDKFSFRKDGGAVYMLLSSDNDNNENRQCVDLTGEDCGEGEVGYIEEFGDQSQEVYILEWLDIFQ